MGDVAITVPVIHELVNQYPDLWITFVSDEKYKPFFEDIPRFDFFAVDLHVQYKGIYGLFNLYRRLKNEKKFTAIADLHNVLRTRILSFFFRFSGLTIKRIDKGRKEKEALTRKHNKILVQLPATFQRYADVFRRLGYPVKLYESLKRKKLPLNNTVKQLVGNNNSVRVGIAPFAKHKEKVYPVDEMEKVVAALSGKGYKQFLFGVGIAEINKLEYWEQKYPGTLNIAGELPLDEELMLISNLDLMVSMDSANMHLASLYGVPVVSIWGATHPFAGFYGFGQDPGNIVQAELYCRPCSVFGNKECYRGDWACMKMIPAQQVIDKIEEVVQKKHQQQ